MSMKQAINEEMHLETKWFAEAKKLTPETLMGFINHVMNDYVHDYGTVCHAVAACAIAAAWAANEAPGSGGGITGFQAGFVMWDFIQQWGFPSNKCGLKIVDYDNMLYPQYETKFAKTLSKDTWEQLKKEAAINLKDCEHCHPDVINHWKKIVGGDVPFGYTVVDRR
jgi:hypothetical protein